MHKKTLKSNERMVMKLQHTNLNHNARAGIWKKASRARDKIWSHANLRTFAPIVSAHPYCARNLLRDVMPRHALSARAVEEMWRYLTIILRNRAEYLLILSRRGRRPSWLNQGIFHKIEQDNCFIIQQIPIAYHLQNEKNYGSMIKTLKASNT